MVKIKDFTFASKNLGGGGTCSPCPTHLPPMNCKPFDRSGCHRRCLETCLPWNPYTIHWAQTTTTGSSNLIEKSAYNSHCCHCYFLIQVPFYRRCFSELGVKTLRQMNCQLFIDVMQILYLLYFNMFYVIIKVTSLILLFIILLIYWLFGSLRVLLVSIRRFFNVLVLKTMLRVNSRFSCCDLQPHVNY